MVDISPLDSQHGFETIMMDAVHTAMVSSPSTAKLNGSVHLRNHGLNVSAISASSKHNCSLPSTGPASDSKASLAHISPDHLHNRMDSSHEQNATHQRRGLQHLRLYYKDSHISELLGSLALLAVVSLLLAFAAVLYFLKISPVNPGEYQTTSFSERDKLLGSKEHAIAYEVVVGLTVCTISLDFCCFLICTAQFLFGSQLLKTSNGEDKANRYLHQGACSRGMAICGFFISIPIFLTGIILYAFIQFRSISAIVISVLLGIGIIFSGIAMIHNVYLWQKEQARGHSFDREELKDYHLMESLRNTSLNTSQVPCMELSTLV